MLADAGVQNPDGLVGQYAAARIIEVCCRAAERRENLRNPAGWINLALRRGWTK